jgi:ferredoxin
VSIRLTVDYAACTGYGICAELLPELITLDQWGFPVIAPGPVPGPLTALARRAVRSCPAMALRAEREEQIRRTGSAGRTGR